MILLYDRAIPSRIFSLTIVLCDFKRMRPKRTQNKGKSMIIRYMHHKNQIIPWLKKLQMLTLETLL